MRTIYKTAKLVFDLYVNELRYTYTTPVPIVFLVIFGLLCSGFTLFVGNLFSTGQADLLPLFIYLPWFLMLLVPAQTMQSWSDDNRHGTIELLLTTPTPVGVMVTAKFLAAAKTVGFAMFTTLPLWLVISYLGDPDHGVILASYLGAVLLGCVYAAIGTLCSALSRSATTAYLLSLALSLLLTASGSRLILGLVGDERVLLSQFLSHVSILNGFNQFAKGIINVANLAYPIALIVIFLFLQTLVIARKR